MYILFYNDYHFEDKIESNFNRSYQNCIAKWFAMNIQFYNKILTFCENAWGVTGKCVDADLKEQGSCPELYQLQMNSVD